jgi:hypothetical protein
VNHSLTFKDPESGAHTNTIEGAWNHAKKAMPKYFKGYLELHMWRKSMKYSNQDPFLTFLNGVKSVYNPSQWKTS